MESAKTTYEIFQEYVGAVFDPMFGWILKPVFAPINNFLNQFYQPQALICALAMFIGAMIWVCFVMKEDYVNKGRPFKGFYTDLRLWTVLSMLPHVLVYVYFY